MRILLLRPYPETAQFGLSPFFQTEPLGLMYLAAALRQAGHSVQLADMRFENRGIAKILIKVALESCYDAPGFIT